MLDDNHQFIHRYGCSVARRQVQEEPQTEIKGLTVFIPFPRESSTNVLDELLEKVKSEELPTTLSIPTQSQTSPIIHFANVHFTSCVSLNDFCLLRLI